MSESARAILELIERDWVELGDAERHVIEDWLTYAHAPDLYMLLRFARRKWRRTPTSSSQTFQAIRDMNDE